MKRFHGLRFLTLSFLFSFLVLLNSCSKDEPTPSSPDPDPEVPTGEQGGGDNGGDSFDISSITDTYYDVAGARMFINGARPIPMILRL